MKEKGKSKKVKSKKSKSKKVDRNINLWVENEDGDTEIVSMEPELRMLYIRWFGCTQIAKKSDFEYWRGRYIQEGILIK